jgi:hypothetical protein
MAEQEKPVEGSHRPEPTPDLPPLPQKPAARRRTLTVRKW